MKQVQSTPARRSGKTRVRTAEDVVQSFKMLGLEDRINNPYCGAESFARGFVRCSKTKFTQVTYAAGSH